MNHREVMQLALEALQYPLETSSGAFDADKAELMSVRAITALRAALAEPEQEPWSTPERFYEQIDRAVENMRQRMLIRTVTMRCKDFDLALPIIKAMEGHVLVGPAPTPHKPQTTHWEGCEAVHPECKTEPLAAWENKYGMKEWQVHAIQAGWMPAPTPRKPLTDEEISVLWDGHTVPVFDKTGINPIVFARAIERAHGIGEQHE